jgi:hypothetical protein
VFAREERRRARELDVDAMSMAPPAGIRSGPHRVQLVLTYQGTPRPTEPPERQLILAGDRTDSDGEALLSQIRARLANPDDLPPAAELWICLDDPANPVVRIRLAELLALGGKRPLNVGVPPRTVVLLVLWLDGAEWPAAAGKLQVNVT